VEAAYAMTDKLKHRVEFDTEGPMKVVRLHREFFGRSAVTEPLLVEVEYEEQDKLFACLVDESEGTLGRSARVDKMPTLVVTPDPILYGSDADRTAAGKLTFVEVKFGEWCPL
jgi:hypothetical protein